jgi:hypothetical protein
LNNVQLFLSIFIPSFLVILSWLSNRSDIRALDTKLDRVGDDLRQFYHLTGKLEGEIEGVKARLK